MSKPKQQFGKTLTRSIALIDIADQRVKDIIAGGPEYIEEDDVIRASAVVAIAAMDYYFTSKFCDVLVTYLKSREPNKELIELLRKSGLDTKVALEIAVMKRPFRRIRTMVQNHLSLYTSHRIDAIDKLFATLGLHGLSGRAQKLSGRRNLLKRVDSLALLRNDIVHTGHITTRGKTKHIDAATLRNQINDLDFFVSLCDTLIDEHVTKP